MEVYQLSAADLVNQIVQLGSDRIYDYVSGKNQIRIVDIQKPNGPIHFIRQDREGKEKPDNITVAKLVKAALAFSRKPNYPLHFDRLFSAGGNDRSALETLLAYTPHFFMCYPKRVDSYTGEIRQDLKHIMWCPTEEHALGEIAYKDYQEDIAELELGIDFGYIDITAEMLGNEFESIEAKRLHTQIQIALVEIGNALNFRSWVAKNDQHIPVRDTSLGNLQGVIQSLDEMPILFDKQIRDAALFVDCIWFTRDGKRIPAVIEIEHSTGVRSGLTRMQQFREVAPALSTNFTVVAPDELREDVIRKANQEIYRRLRARYMPYSTVRILYGLIQRYKLTNVVDHSFVEPFMEQIIGD